MSPRESTSQCQTEQYLPIDVGCNPLTVAANPVEDDSSYDENVAHDNEHSSLPDWINPSVSSSWGKPLEVPEWEEYNQHAPFHHNHAIYRKNNGWQGNDFCHDKATSPMYISHYHTSYPSAEHNGVGTVLTGIARFTKLAESHMGFCHGGSMCAAMDDVMGWIGFCTTGKCLPWSGFTAQVNTSLKKPIPVNTYLKIEAKIVKREGRKVHIEAALIDPSSTNCMHATGEGLFILKKGIE